MYNNVVFQIFDSDAAVRCVGNDDIPFSLLFWQSFSVAKISWDPCSAVHGVSKICPPIEKLYVLFLIVSGCKNCTAYCGARALKRFPLKKAIDYQVMVVDGQLRVGITVGNVCS